MLSHCAVTLSRQHCILHRHLQWCPARPYTVSGRSVKPYIILPQRIRRCRQQLRADIQHSQLELPQRAPSSVANIKPASRPSVRDTATRQTCPATTSTAATVATRTAATTSSRPADMAVVEDMAPTRTVARTHTARITHSQSVYHHPARPMYVVVLTDR